MAKKSYAPTAPYSELKRVETALEQAQTVAEIRQLVAVDGPKVGYKAFCYLLSRKMTAESMKPDEAGAVAATCESQGEVDKAQEIYRRILEAHPEHPMAQGKV